MNIQPQLEATGRVTCWQRTPGCVSTSTGGSFGAVWKVSIFFTATAIACFSSSAQAFASGGNFLSRHLQCGNRGFIKLRAVFLQGLIAACFYVIENR